jgi:DNA-binding MarR family transcriptional regulator
MKLQEKYLESVRYEFNLSRIEIIILTFLHNNPSYDSARDIVEFRMLQRGNVSAAVDTLEKKGYLIRYTDPDDKRIVHLKLTEQTNDIVHAIEEKQEALVSCIFAGFSEDEKKNFAAYNARLYQNVMSHLK